jgi:hypothetical protein
VAPSRARSKATCSRVEIAARLQRELDAEAKLMSRNKRLVPNDFTVHLSQHDHDKLAPYASTLNAELATELRNHAREMAYAFNGPIKIAFELDASLPTGRFTVSSQAVAGITPRAGRASETAISRAPLVLEFNGTRHPLQPPGLVIGRGSDADLRINDPESRGACPDPSNRPARPADRHRRSWFDQRHRGNGQTVQQAVLQEGSRIEIGSTRMLVHAPAGR